MVKAIVCDPGELKSVVTVEKNTITRQDDATWDSGWASDGTRHVKIEPLSGQEMVEAQALHAEAKLRVTLRYYAGLEPSNYRFKIDSRILGIKSVQNIDEGNQWMQCICGEEVASA